MHFSSGQCCRECNPKRIRGGVDNCDAGKPCSTVVSLRFSKFPLHLRCRDLVLAPLDEPVLVPISPHPIARCWLHIAQIFVHEIGEIFPLLAVSASPVDLHTWQFAARLRDAMSVVSGSHLLEARLTFAGLQQHCELRHLLCNELGA